MRFEYAVYLLNKNIAQLRWHCDTPTSDLRPTLTNLGSLLESLTTREPEEPLPSVRLVLPLAPAVLKGVAPVLSRGTPTRAQQQQSPQFQSVVAGSPRDRRQSDSESISSAKDSDSSDVAPAGIDESRLQPTSNDADLSQTVEDHGIDESFQMPKEDTSLLLAMTNGLESSLYERVDDCCEEPMLVDGVISEGGETRPSADETVQPAVNGEAERSAEAGRSAEVLEVGVAADLFWDSVTSRAQVLSVPTSFKISRQKPFSPY